MSELTTNINLDDLAAEVEKEHRAVENHFKQAVVHAIKAGEALNEAKKLVKHGDWYDWLETNFKFTTRTATNYMLLASLPEEIRNSVSDLTLREALAAIASTKQKTIEDQGKTLDGEAEEEGEPTETDREPNRMEGIGGAHDDDAEDQGRSPEQKADDIATRVIHDALQESHWKQVDHRLVLQTLIQKLTEQLSQTVIPLSAEESADARKALYSASEEAPAEPKKRGRPPGSKNKPKETPEESPEPAPATTGNEVDPEQSAAAMRAAHESPLVPGNLDIPAYLRRDQQSGSVDGAA
jgi:hypothetical protein